MGSQIWHPSKNNLWKFRSNRNDAISRDIEIGRRNPRDVTTKGTKTNLTCGETSFHKIWSLWQLIGPQINRKRTQFRETNVKEQVFMFAPLLRLI